MKTLFQMGDKNHTYSIEIPKGTNQYFMIEVRQDPDGISDSILLAGKFNVAFTKYDFTSFTTDADIYDFNGYSLQKNYHYVLIEPDIVNNYNNINQGPNEEWYII